MADTRFLKDQVEQYVRAALKGEYGVGFDSRFLKLSTGGRHEFDAVSEDEQIVATIKSSSGKTAAGNLPSGKIQAVEAELYYLTLVDAPVRMVVLTTPQFFDIMRGRLKGKLAPGLHLKLVELPSELQALASRVQQKASREVSNTV
ncbi:MAG: hypothetical protein QME79_12110 [Bacillota bacterium]|nr:hypothetical protein [Bacillota bacterium]